MEEWPLVRSPAGKKKIHDHVFLRFKPDAEPHQVPLDVEIPPAVPGPDIKKEFLPIFLHRWKKSTRKWGGKQIEKQGKKLASQGQAL